MSHGSVIFSGPADLATKYFIQHPSYDIVRSSAFDATLLVAPTPNTSYSTNTQTPSETNGTKVVPSLSAFPFGPPNASPFGMKPGVSAMNDPMEYLLKISAVKINRKERWPIGAGGSKTSSASSIHSEEAERQRSSQRSLDDNGGGVIFIGPCASDLQEVGWGETLAVMWRQGMLLFQRSYFSLFRRWHLIGSAIAIHLCFALIFPITLGDSSNDEYGIAILHSVNFCLTNSYIDSTYMFVFARQQLWPILAMDACF
jgi:hypothetical protein